MTSGGIYRTCLHKEMTHTAALQLVADAARMTSLTFEKSPIFAGQGHLAIPQLWALVSRFGMFNVLEVAVHTNLQVTLVALKHAVKGRGGCLGLPEAILAVSMASGVVTYALTAARCVKLSREVRNSIATWKKDFHRLPGSPDPDEDEEQFIKYIREQGIQADPRKLSSESHGLCALFIIISIIYWVFIIYALAKLGAVYVCRDCVWNLSGCVELR